MENIEKIISELKNVPNPLSNTQIEEILEHIHDAKHIFISGSGRSGLMASSFANRLLQMGLSVSVVGEITSPHVKKGDVLIFNSASGSSEKLVSQAKEAKKYGVMIILITTNIDSSLAKLSNLVVKVEAQSKYSETESIQPMGAIFEQYSLLLFDSLVLSYMSKYQISEQIMKDNHADME